MTILGVLKYGQSTPLGKYTYAYNPSGTVHSRTNARDAALSEIYGPLSSLNRNFEARRGENFVGSSIAEAFSRAVVEKLLDFGKTMIGDADQIRAFGKELPNQAVGVFVCAALPRAVRLRKVDLQSSFLRQPLVLGELPAVVQRQCLPPQAIPDITPHFRPLHLGDPRTFTPTQPSLSVGRHRPISSRNCQTRP